MARSSLLTNRVLEDTMTGSPSSSGSADEQSLISYLKSLSGSDAQSDEEQPELQDLFEIFGYDLG